MGLVLRWWQWWENRSTTRAVRAGCVAFVLLAMPALALPGAADAIKPPRQDPFYTAPANLASHSRGAILASRPVHLAAFAVLPQKVKAWQLLYRTTNYRGRPEATVTTVLLPAGGKPRGLLSYQIAEDAVAPQCAMSYTLRGGSAVEPINQAETFLIDAAVAQGFAVSVPDYEGPNGDFGAARQPGYAILDGIRASERFGPLGLHGVSTPVGIWGYSGGSLASGWAAQVQRRYAPKLNLRGVAVGGFVTNVAQALQQINGGFGAGLIVSVLAGVTRTVPALAAAINTYTTPAGKAILAKGASQCELANVTQYAFTNLNKYLTVPLTQLLALPAIKSAVAGIDLGGTAPTAPLFVYHSVDDELIPIAGADATVAKYCAGRDSVTYTRDILSEHGSLAFIGAPQALSWLTQRLTGGAVPHGCTTTTVLSMLLNPTTLRGGAQLLLGDARALLDQPIGPTGIF
jgi:hypothetical protein